MSHLCAPVRMQRFAQECGAFERKSAMQTAEEFLRRDQRPSSTAVVRLVDGGETAPFRAHFADWAAEEPATPMVAGAGVDANGVLQIWRVESFALVEEPPMTYGHFVTLFSYVVCYHYVPAIASSAADASGERHLIYCVQGPDSKPDDAAAAVVLAQHMADALGGTPTHVRMVLGHEPDHFCALFKGSMVVRKQLKEEEPPPPPRTHTHTLLARARTLCTHPRAHAAPARPPARARVTARPAGLLSHCPAPVAIPLEPTDVLHCGSIFTGQPALRGMQAWRRRGRRRASMAWATRCLAAAVRCTFNSPCGVRQVYLFRISAPSDIAARAFEVTPPARPPAPSLAPAAAALTPPPCQACSAAAGMNQGHARTVRLIASHGGSPVSPRDAAPSQSSSLRRRGEAQTRRPVSE